MVCRSNEAENRGRKPKVESKLFIGRNWNLASLLQRECYVPAAAVADGAAGATAAAAAASNAAVDASMMVSSAPASRYSCLLYTSPSPRDRTRSRMPSSA